MKKQEFLKALRKKLRSLPKKEREERISFYSEMIDDRIEEGLTEEEAVAAMDEKTAEEKNLISDEEDKEKPRKNTKLTPLAVILLILGSPIWLSLIISIAAIAISLCASLLAVFVSLWATVLGLAAGAVGGVFAGFVLLFTENTFSGLVILSLCLISAGLAIFGFFGCLVLTRYVIILSKKIFSYLIKSFK